MRSFWSAAISAKPLAVYLGSVAILATFAAVSLAVLCRQIVETLPEKTADHLSDEPRSRVAQARLFHRRSEARRQARAQAEANEAKLHRWPSRFAEVRGLFEPSFGAPSEEPEDDAGHARTDMRTGGDQSVVSYRTVCVTLCDGSFTPMSFATTRAYFRADQDKCETGAAVPSRLYVAPNPGATLETMTDLDGQPYANLATAFRFRTAYDPSCRPRAPELPRVAEAEADAGVTPTPPNVTVPRVTAAQPATVEMAALDIPRAPEISEVQVTIVAEAVPSMPVETVQPDGVTDAKVYRKTATRQQTSRPMRLGASEPDLYEDAWYDAGNKKFNGRDWRLSAYQHY